MDDTATPCLEYPDDQAPPPGRLMWDASPLYALDGQEFLRMSVSTAVLGVTVRCMVRTVNQKGVIKRHIVTVTPTIVRNLTSTTIAIGDGAILDASARVLAGSPLFGQTGVILDLVQSNSGEQQPTGTLAYGYVTPNSPLYSPTNQQYSFVDGPGAVRSVLGSVPGIGADITETVPAGARWELISFTSLLTTTAGVANRIPALTLDDGAQVYFRDSPAFTQVASLADNYCWANGNNKIATPAASAIPGNLPNDNRLLAGHRIRTVTLNLQGTDQWTAPIYLVREWLEL